MRRVLFTRAAKADFDAAMEFYDSEAPEISDRFQQAVDDIIQRIEDNPRQFAPSSHKARRAVVRRFPYLVIFREHADDCYVVAVFHTSRDPGVWQARMS
jgi:plasmid stabilization system protein ParE